jgi:hypothetical protein
MTFLLLPPFSHPSPKTPLWRHIRLSQLLAVLESRSLWFSAISQLEDKFEGSYTKRDVRRQEQLIQATKRRRGAPIEIGEDFVARTRQRVRERVFVNCWYSGNDESAALWHWLARHADFVAIQTTFGELQRAVRARIYSGTVQYLDYERRRIPQGSVLNPYFCKRMSFQFENELRLLRYESQLPASQIPKGLRTPVNLKLLVRRVMVAPYAPTWIGDTVQSVVDRYGLKCVVTSSGIDADPP